MKNISLVLSHYFQFARLKFNIILYLILYFEIFYSLHIIMLSSFAEYIINYFLNTLALIILNKP